MAMMELMVYFVFLRCSQLFGIYFLLKTRTLKIQLHFTAASEVALLLWLDLMYLANEINVERLSATLPTVDM
jgi:hypothetical protein